MANLVILRDKSDIIKMPEFLMDNIFVMYGGRHFYGYKCAPLFADSPFGRLDTWVSQLKRKKASPVL